MTTAIVTMKLGRSLRGAVGYGCQLCEQDLHLSHV